MEPISVIRSRTVVMPQDDIDTDQIIPARYLTTTTREGLGEAAFADWRYDAAGQPKPDFVLNQDAARGCAILVAGNNFGCGSSREHAPWSLHDFGFRAVISTEIADIFRSNSLKNGLLPVVVDKETHRWLIEHPGVEVEIDLGERSVRLPDGRSVTFPIDGFSRYCLMNGIDQLGFLLQQEEHIRKFEQNRPWQP
jgi:3-isopropylmalate/(R)-2-methylmalate dehydratase small subunit